MNHEQIHLMEYIHSLLGENLESSCLGMSTLSLILSFYTNNDNLESLTLNDLISIFHNPQDIEKVVKKRPESEFTASYVDPMPDWLKNGYAQRYIEIFRQLRREIWKNLPKTSASFCLE